MFDAVHLEGNSFKQGCLFNQLNKEKINYKSAKETLGLLDAIHSRLFNEIIYDWIEYKVDGMNMNDGGLHTKVMCALKEMRQKYVTKASIIDLIKSVQYDMAMEILILLSGGTDPYSGNPIKEGNWAIFNLDSFGNPRYKLQCLPQSFERFVCSDYPEKSPL